MRFLIDTACDRASWHGPHLPGSRSGPGLRGNLALALLHATLRRLAPGSRANRR
jgi:hypothetical protein